MIVMAKNKSDQKRRIENVLSALKHDKLAIASLVFLVIIIALALLAPILPLDPNTTDVRNMFQPPSPAAFCASLNAQALVTSAMPIC